MHTGSMKIFEPPELMKLYKVYLFNMRLQNDDVQDFHTRWDQAPPAVSEIPTGMVMEGLYKSKLQDYVQLQTVFALYEQENVRNNEPPIYSRLQTIVRRHIDQTTRTRNFRARNETVERRVKKREKRQRGEESAESYLWKAIGQRSEGDSCTIPDKIITEMRGADFYFFEVIKMVKFVIQCGFKNFRMN